MRRFVALRSLVWSSMDWRWMKVMAVAVSASLSIFPSSVFAQCEGKIIDYGTNPSGYVQVRGNYFIDGILQTTGQEGNFVTLLFDPRIVSNETPDQFLSDVTKAVHDHCNRLIEVSYRMKTNHDPLEEFRISSMNQAISQLNSSGIDVSKIDVTVTSSPVLIDRSGSGSATEEWDISSDGSKTIKTISPIPLPN